MIRHMVLFNVLPTASQAELRTVIDAARDDLSQIPGVRNLALSTAFEVVQPPAYTHGLTMEFADEAALRAYIDHPVHQNFRKLFAPIRDTYVVMDLTDAKAPA
ncbi:MAG: Dabb family protein [Chloroflexota bacterium]